MKSFCRPSPYSISAFAHLSGKQVSTRRLVTRTLAIPPAIDGFVPDSPLSVITHDLDYLENALDIDLHAPLETVVEAHDQVVCTLNPQVAQQRAKELDEKLQELHEELSNAHEAIHKTETKMQESLRYVIEMERQMSRLSSANPELAKNAQAAPEVSKGMQQCSDGLRNQEGGIKNNLELSSGLKEHWYPVEFSSKLKKELLLPMELFGEKWVLLRGKDGAVVCLEDTCSRRSCPLSMDQMCDGHHVQCAYRGWDTQSHDTGVETPSTKFCNGMKMKALPVAEVDGFVWIWPGENEPTAIPQCSNPPRGFEIHAELMLQVPVEHGLLLENLLDLAHAPFTHTSTFAKGWPIPDAVKFRTNKLLGGKWDPYPIDMSFETPCMVVSLIGLQQPGKIEQGARAASCAHHLHQLHVCLPTNNRSTRLLYRMSLDFLHWTRHIPGIQKIWSNVAKQVLGEDLILVEGQQDRMLRGSSVWRNPVTYDKLGVRYRRWRNATSKSESNEVAEELTTMSAAEIFALDDQPNRTS